MRKSSTTFGSFLPLVGLFLGAAGCAAPHSGEPEKPTPTVSVSYPLQRDVTDYQDYTGRTAAVDSVQVQARVTGYLDKINFTEGAEVTEGAVLYEIDPRPYKASYDAAKAQVDQNAASLELAHQNYARAKTLYYSKPPASKRPNSTTMRLRRSRPSRTWIMPRQNWRPRNSTWIGPTSRRPSAD